jgi:hypothetical protein
LGGRRVLDAVLRGQGDPSLRVHPATGRSGCKGRQLSEKAFHPRWRKEFQVFGGLAARISEGVEHPPRRKHERTGRRVDDLVTQAERQFALEDVPTFFRAAVNVWDRLLAPTGALNSSIEYAPPVSWPTALITKSRPRDSDDLAFARLGHNRRVTLVHAVLNSQMLLVQMSPP